MICSCGATFHKVHQERNVCSCGAVYDGSGNLTDGKTLNVANNEPEIVSSSEVLFSHYNKPGSALESLIPGWAVQFKTGCKCKDYRDKMDRWQTRGCEAREDMIVAHLMAQSDKLIAVFRGIPTPLRRMAAKRLFRKAIELSKIESESR